MNTTAQPQVISDWLKARQIVEVECLVPDMSGIARGKFIPIDQLLGEAFTKLPEYVLIQSGAGEGPADPWSLIDPTDKDMILRPDAASMRVVPWAAEPTAQIVHDCFTQSGEPHPLSSRNVLRRVLSLYDKAGLRPVVAPEAEFYLVSKNLNPDDVISAAAGRSGRSESAGLSYGIEAATAFDDVLNEVYAHAEAQELQIDTLVHELGAAQMEINFSHGDALCLADQVFAFKRLLRETALKHGMYATFMAKPMQEEPGSSMHIHQSVVETDSGRNIFADDAGNLSNEFLSYIAGLQRYTPELISFYAPNVNSYRRLAPDISAPINLAWGMDNRTTAFRVPQSEPQGTRVENRLPGSDTNPYLTFAATLASGLLGMQQKLKPTEPHAGTANTVSVEMARTLEEGLRALGDTEALTETIGAQFIEAYRTVKLNEFETFNRVVTAWEREHLLLLV